jgi:hypothetical protein
MVKSEYFHYHKLAIFKQLNSFGPNTKRESKPFEWTMMLCAVVRVGQRISAAQNQKAIKSNQHGRQMAAPPQTMSRNCVQIKRQMRVHACCTVNKGIPWKFSGFGQNLAKSRCILKYLKFKFTNS